MHSTRSPLAVTLEVRQQCTSGHGHEAQEGGCGMSETMGTGPADAKGPTDPEAHGGPKMSALADEADGDRPEAMAGMDDMRATANETIDQISAQAKDALSNAKEAADGGVAYVKAKYRENPVLVIAVGAAALIGVTTVLKAVFRR